MQVTDDTRRPVSEERACCPGLSDHLSPGMFRALGDPNRVRLLVSLAESGRERTVSEMRQCCPVDLSVVSRHLAVLREAGVVEARRRGREVLYSVRFAELAAVLRGLADAIEACCPPDENRQRAGEEDEEDDA